MFLEKFIKYQEVEYKTKSGSLATRTLKSTYFKLICDNCQSVFERISSDVRTNDFKHFCNKCGNAQGYTNRIRRNVQNVQEALMGTKIKDANGNILVYVGSDYLYGNTYGGRIEEHIYVMQENIGRHIGVDEVVHHIDGDKSNNDISNLDLCTKKQHSDLHNKAANDLIFELYKRNILGYDRDKKIYYIID